MTRILLVDDHPMIRTALDVLLRGTRFSLSATAATCEQAMTMLDADAWDMLVLDLSLPDGSGMDVLGRLRRTQPDRPVVLATAAIDDRPLAEALALKVNGLFLKGSDPALLLECLDAVAHGRSWIDPDLRDRASAARGPAPESPLSPREREVVALVSKGLRNRDIADRLGVKEGTVKVYLHKIFEKLEVASRTELAMRADEFLR